MSRQHKIVSKSPTIPIYFYHAKTIATLRIESLKNILFKKQLKINEANRKILGVQCRFLAVRYSQLIKKE